MRMPTPKFTPSKFIDGMKELFWPDKSERYYVIKRIMGGIVLFVAAYFIYQIFFGGN